MAEHIHWKKTTNPNYLGAYAFDEGKDLIVKISDVGEEPVVGQNGTSENCMVMHFDGDVKPLILNKTNMKRIEKALETPYLDEWCGKKIQLYVEKNVPAFGTVTDAVRVREFAPQGK